MREQMFSMARRNLAIAPNAGQVSGSVAMRYALLHYQH